MSTIKTVEIPNTPWHLLRVTDIKRDDNKLTVAYDGYGGMHWSVIDDIPLDNEEKLLEAAYKVQKQVKEKLGFL